MIEFIKPSYIDALRLNAILYHCYVTEDGVNFKNNFSPATLIYIELDEIDQPALMLNDVMLNSVNDSNISVDDRDFIASLLAYKKNFNDAVIAGWIVDPATTSAGGAT